MVLRLWDSPAVTRLTGLTAAIAIAAAASLQFGWQLQWHSALLYGLLQALAARWPVILPGTGLRLVFLSGFLFEALWHHGLLTALAVLLVEFAIRIIVLYTKEPLWTWSELLGTAASVALAAAIPWILTGHAGVYPHDSLPPLGSPHLISVYAFWTLLVLLRALVVAPRHRRDPMREFFLSMQQTWWAPLVYLGLAWAMEATHESPYHLRGFLGLLFLGLQYQAGAVFSTLLQDRAVSQLIRLYPSQSSWQRQRAQRVLKVAYAIGRVLPLTAQEQRLVGYAALLQDYLPADGAPLPLWMPEAPSAEQRAALKQRVEAVANHIARDGALTEVAEVIRLRAEAFDGRPAPEGLPVVAQVLIAANAVVAVQEGQEQVEGDAAAVDWLRRHSANSFTPRIMTALDLAFRSGTAATLGQGLPETVRQLHGLMIGSGDSPTLLAGLRDMWAHLRGRVGLAPELPSEVQAVSRMASLFASSTDTIQTAQVAAEAVGRLMGAKVALALNEPGGSELLMRFRAAYGFSTLQVTDALINMDSPPITHGLMAREPVQVADLREISVPLAQETARLEAIRSMLFVPLVARGRLSGVLMVGRTDYHWFTPREVGVIQLMADQAAIALENARLMAEAAARLRHTESLKAFTDTLLDNLHASIIVVDPEGLLVTANAAARGRLGFNPEADSGRNLPSGLYDAFQVAAALRGQSVPEHDVEWNGAILAVETVPMKDSHGVLLGAICLARDVTAVRSMESQVRRVEKLAAVGELAAGAAHEIRNPLTAIRGFIQLVQARSGGDSEYFRIIIGEIDRIDGIIRDLLLLARPSDLQRAVTSLSGLVGEILVLNESAFRQQRIEVNVAVDPAADMAPVDPKATRQLLHNLIINAVQAMPFGGKLTLRIRPAAAGEVALEVEDTGVGISPENMERLFVPFFTTKEEGTGLGLALCYSIVHAHGGRIDVQSREGVGTTFTVTLPQTHL